MNNKPVAWMDSYGNICLDIDKRINQGKITAKYNYDSCDIPLYTHPVKEQEPDLYSEDGFPLWTSPQLKQLTDEEIEECYWGDGYPDNPRHPKEFAKAILRKAQEK